MTSEPPAGDHRCAADIGDAECSAVGAAPQGVPLAQQRGTQMNVRTTTHGVAIGLLFLGPLFAMAATEKGAQQVLSTRDIAVLVGKATVSIKVLASDGTVRSGSGFIVEPSGTVITNVHVVEGAKQIEVHTNTGDVYEPAGVRVADARRDIAVLQLAACNLPTVKLADSDTIAPGDHVVVIGTALGVLENSVTAGVISGIREVDGSRLFQMDAAVSPGNSGGPVANDHGEVIGITVAKLTGGQSLNFAIPINYARGELTLPVQQGLAALTASGHSQLLAATQSLSQRGGNRCRQGTASTCKYQGMSC
jgi:S1-C subfamily serine protease